MPRKSRRVSGATRASAPGGPGFRSGLVALLGRPNVGKSTLLNRLVGQTVAIVTPVAQTTRRRKRGIVHGRGYQMVLLDTPGLFVEPSGRQPALRRKMTVEALAALHEADLALLLVEADGRGSRPHEDREDQTVLKALRASGRPALLVVNKIDRLKDRRRIAAIEKAYLALGLFSGCVAVSALRGQGLGRLLDVIAAHLPEGPPFFSQDMVTDESERGIAAELVRQQVILQTDDEIPFRSAVEIVAFRSGAAGRPTVIEAVIYVERESQKGIVIGRGGARLKAIGIAARRNIESMLGEKVYLELRVKAAPGWYKTEAGLLHAGQRYP